MTILIRFSIGRILLHVLAILGDRCVRLHLQGIARELPCMPSIRSVLDRARDRLVGALALYLAEPLEPGVSDPSVDPRRLTTVLNRGDVLLTDGNSRAAALIKCLTRSRWSHVSVYVGPLDDGPDPPCVIEAHIAAGVRSIRLSEIDARRLLVLRPMSLSDTDRDRLADWVVARIGSEYDLAHASRLLRNALRPLVPHRFRSPPRAMACSASRFICCSLLAHAFACVGYPILVDEPRLGHAVTADPDLVPSDFERASLFEIVRASTA